MIHALIFDFDGLILETEQPIFQSWQEIYRAHGCHLPLDCWTQIIGTTDPLFEPFDYLIEQCGKPLKRAEIERQQRQREAELIAHQPILPGVGQYLADARRLGLKVGLASSSSCEWITTHLTRLGLISYFDCLRTADDAPRTKPDPALYLSVLAALDIRAEQAIAFEDSPNGILAAKRAGLFCVAVPNEMTRDLPLDHADTRLNSLAELPLEELLARVNGTPDEIVTDSTKEAMAFGIDAFSILR